MERRGGASASTRRRSAECRNRSQSRKWAQELVRSLVPNDVSLADELIRERKEEVAGE